MVLLFATNNSHKLREAREILGSAFEIKSLADIHLDTEIPETGETIEDNAIQKAWYIYKLTGMNCFADDTGLEIDALDDRPGVYSARYAGEDCSFDDNIRKVLSELSGEENRKAKFRCAVCLILDGKEYLFEGNVHGTILKERKGTGGFGYDPVFIPVSHSQTFAEMAPHLKNGISHRGRAITRMLKFLQS